MIYQNRNTSDSNIIIQISNNDKNDINVVFSKIEISIKSLQQEFGVHLQSVECITRFIRQKDKRIFLNKNKKIAFEKLTKQKKIAKENIKQKAK